MDRRNEYRVRPSPHSGAFYSEFRAPRCWGLWWSDWQKIDWHHTADEAERYCRRHAGEGTKPLGRLPPDTEAAQSGEPLFGHEFKVGGTD